MNGVIQYTIRPYDTIWMLAQVFNTTVDSIMDLNPGIDPRNLLVGQVIKISPGHQLHPSTQGRTGTTGAGMMAPGGMGTTGTGMTMPGGTGMPGGQTTMPGRTGTGNTGMMMPGGTGMPGGQTTMPGRTGTGNTGMMMPGGTGMPGGQTTMPGRTGTGNTGMMMPGGAGTTGGQMTMPGRTGTGNTGMMMPGGMNNNSSWGNTDMNDMDGIDEDIEDLRDYLRLLWSQHVYWTRMAAMGIIHELPEAQLIQQRLLRNPVDFANAFLPFYGDEFAREFEQLFTDHIAIAAEIINAGKAGDNNAVAEANTRWQENAESIAELLGSINPDWDADDWSAMLDEHLQLLGDNIALMLAGRYGDSINAFDDIEAQALEMGDMMAEGIAEQFSESR